MGLKAAIKYSTAPGISPGIGGMVKSSLPIVMTVGSLESILEKGLSLVLGLDGKDYPFLIIHL